MSCPEMQSRKEFVRVDTVFVISWCESSIGVHSQQDANTWTFQRLIWKWHVGQERCWIKILSFQSTTKINLHIFHNSDIYDGEKILKHSKKSMKYVQGVRGIQLKIMHLMWSDRRKVDMREECLVNNNYNTTNEIRTGAFRTSEFEYETEQM